MCIELEKSVKHQSKSYIHVLDIRTSGLEQELSRVTPDSAANEPTGVVSAVTRAWTNRPRYIWEPDSVTAEHVVSVGHTQRRGKNNTQNNSTVEPIELRKSKCASCVVSHQVTIMTNYRASQNNQEEKNVSSPYKESRNNMPIYG